MVVEEVAVEKEVGKVGKKREKSAEQKTWEAQPLQEKCKGQV